MLTGETGACFIRHLTKMNGSSFNASPRPSRFRVEREAVAAFATKSLAAAGSASAADILARLYEPSLDARKLVAMLEAQPLLVLRIMKVANGALYGQAGRIGSLDRGVQVIGLDTVRGIITAACLNRRMFFTPPNGIADRDALYEHSVATAVAARELAQIVEPGLASQAFLAGLVHDLGMALLANVEAAGWAEQLASIDASVDVHPATLIAQEAQLLGLDHAAAATAAFEAWKLPAWLGEAVNAHHSPETAPVGGRTLARILFLADRLAGQCGKGSPYGDPSPELDAETAGLLGLSVAELGGLTAAVLEELTTLSCALDS